MRRMSHTPRIAKATASFALSPLRVSDRLSHTFAKFSPPSHALLCDRLLSRTCLRWYTHTAHVAVASTGNRQATAALSGMYTALRHQHRAPCDKVESTEYGSVSLSVAPNEGSADTRKDQSDDSMARRNVAQHASPQANPSIDATASRGVNSANDDPASACCEHATNQNSSKDSTDSQSTGEQQERQIQCNSPNSAALAFEAWSREAGGCSASEFIDGTRQAYYSLGALLNKMFDQAESMHRTREKAPKKSVDALAELRVQLSRDFLAERLWDKMVLKAWEGSVANETLMGEGEIRSVLTGIMNILPTSLHFARFILDTWQLQSERSANLYSLAGPGDYIYHADLVLFAPLQGSKPAMKSVAVNTELVVLDGQPRQGTPRYTDSDTRTVSRVREHVSHHSGDDTNRRASSDSTPCRNTTANTTAATSQSASKDTLPMGAAHVAARALEVLQGRRPSLRIDDSVPPRSARRLAQRKKTVSSSSSAAPHAATATIHRKEGEQKVEDGEGQSTATQASHDGAEPASEHNTKSSSLHGNGSSSSSSSSEATEKDGVCIYLNKMAIRPVPSSALAVAVVCADVIVPPSRYTPHFDWFYDRIEGHESDYERIAAAHTFATYPPPSLVTLIDFVARMITGKTAKFTLTRSVSNLIGVPPNIGEHPPASRKFLCFYMDTARRWMLADVVPISLVMAAQKYST